MLLWSMDSSNGCCSDGRRKPLQLLTGIFGRKCRRETQRENEKMNNSREKLNWLDGDGNDEDDSEGELLLIPEPREALHSPYHARTIDQDMEHLRLSRQDNPYLQILASRECLHDSSDSESIEEKHLMSKENMGRSAEHPLTLTEVHARLVRSPPPVMWTRSRNSEPSFTHLIQGSGGKDDSVFNFPPSNLQIPMSPTQRHTQSDKVKFLTPSPKCADGFHGRRIKESAVEALSARFNLSPQPRRRSKDHVPNFLGF